MEPELSRPVKIVWGDKGHERAEVSTLMDLDAVLDRLQRDPDQEQPPIIDVAVAGLGLMRVGLSSGKAVLSVMRSSFDPPYFNSIGEDKQGTELIFSYRGHWTEFPARLAIPVDEARAAVRRFASGEFLPDNISWEET